MVKNISNNKKVLQEQVARLTNEIEELQLEREESKKNVLHFMQEADVARQELKKTQELVNELTASSTNHRREGYLSPPPESVAFSDEDNDIDIDSHSIVSSTNHKRSTVPSRVSTVPSRVSTLLSRLALLDDDKCEKMFELLENEMTLEKLTKQVRQTSDLLSKQMSENDILSEKLDQLTEEYNVTRETLKVESERADIMENRWKDSESQLEGAENLLQSLQNELKQHKQEWTTTATVTDNGLLDKELCRSRQDLAITVKSYNDCKMKLEETEHTLKYLQEKYDEIQSVHSCLKDKQLEEMNQARARENYLKTINKTLRDELRKLNKVEEDLVNIEYLRNVIIKFLERKNTRAQLVPILSTLLKCTGEDQCRLRKLVRNKMIES